MMTSDKIAARELQLYIENDSQLYESQLISVVKNIQMVLLLSACLEQVWAPRPSV